VVYVGTSDGNVRRSADAGDTFAPAATTLPSASIGEIAVASNDPLQALAAVRTYAAGVQLWATVDGGGTWSNVTGNLPAVPARAVLRIPGSTRTFVGTDAGAFVADLPLTATPSAPTWTRVAGLPAFAVVTDLVYQASTQTVVAATYGRGLWALINASTAVTGLRGDINRDGTVTAADALLIQRLLVGNAPQAGVATFPHGDANCDNRVTSADVLVTLRFAAGLGTSGTCVNTIQ
ncbi:MAG: dockerin type I repeat-containing protein, partial [Gemmatimonadetes bacterium]|nr:dockerin type I repeat-containing protein [Gemmatimonadota bacterium]